MPSHARAGRRDHGFALLVLLGIVGIGSVGILLAVQAIANVGADRVLRTERNLHTAAAAVRASFVANGAFAGSLTAAATAGGLDPTASWRRDPWFDADLQYRNVATGRRLRSRGPDLRLNTADDVDVVVAAEPIVRSRQRGRLRLIRAVLARSPYAFSASMSPTDAAAMLDALRDHAIALRRWRTADTAARVALQATLDASTATVTALRAAYGLPALPGVTALLVALGIPDTRAYDGNGRRWLTDPVLGVRARGYDRQGGTDDDM
ncbi:MAG: hypothetical protein JNL08_00640 [Planctomycetes bacterium]|nr:hypothetical protein [Planctomycetota bacterium]